MSDVQKTIDRVDLEYEISRLRLELGSCRQELWNLVWDGLEMNKAVYDKATDAMLYGDH